MNTRAICRFLLRPGGRRETEPCERHQVAAAALLVECARIDAQLLEEERATICRLVREQFGLDESTADALVSLAERRSDEAWSRWLFTETVRRSFDDEGRRDVVARLWDVALANGSLHPFEERLVRQVAQELGLPEEVADETRHAAWARYRARRPAGTPPSQGR